LSFPKRALAFLNSQAMAIHGLAHRTSSIFATPSGEWRLGGLDLLSSTREAEREAGVIWTMGTLLLGREEGISPEVRKAGWGVLKECVLFLARNHPPRGRRADPLTASRSDSTSNDAYSLGLLIHAIFNPTHGLPATVQPPHPAPQPSSRGAIPPALFLAFKKLLNPSPKSRLTAAGLLQDGGGLGEGRQGFFGSNRFVWVGDGLEGWGLKGEAERSEILRAIQPPAPVFPPAFQTHKILPMLLHSLSLPSSAASATSSPSQLLPLVISFGKLVPPEDYTKLVLNPVVALFKSPDRGTRMALLEGLAELEPFMDEKCIREQVWPHLVSRFECSRSFRAYRSLKRCNAPVDHRLQRHRPHHPRSHRQGHAAHRAEGAPPMSPAL
jgi:SCY1-like protein 1